MNEDLKTLEEQLTKLKKEQQAVQAIQDQFIREKVLPISTKVDALEYEISIRKIGLEENTYWKLKWEEDEDSNYSEWRYYKILNRSAHQMDTFQIIEGEDCSNCYISVTIQNCGWFQQATKISQAEFEEILKRVLYRMQHQLDASAFFEADLEEEEKDKSEEIKQRIERKKLREEANKSRKLSEWDRQ
jgi:hypothetical protein